ncbi:CDGSH iron-sulfur domain-containing protein [Nitrospinota bacterium]
MAEPTVAQKGPYKIQMEKTEKVAWCACGQSAKQPFCDGSHKGSEFKPVILDVEAGKMYAFCGCKKSGKSPMCDGTHRSL